MKRVYEASNGAEASILRDMLADIGIIARIDGEYLQGGMGELPAFGLVGISVADKDIENALAFFREWESGVFDVNEGDMHE